MIVLYGYPLREETLCVVLDSFGLALSAALALRIGCFFDESSLRMVVVFLSFMFLGGIVLCMTRFWHRAKFFSLQNLIYNASVGIACQVLMLPVLEMCGCQNIFWFFMTGSFFITLFFLFSQAVINLCTSIND